MLAVIPLVLIVPFFSQSMNNSASKRSDKNFTCCLLTLLRCEFHYENRESFFVCVLFSVKFVWQDQY